jgi:transposase
MNDVKYVALDVHKTTTTMTVVDVKGEILDHGVFKTTGEMLISRVGGLKGTVKVTLEEGCQAAWVYDTLRPHVGEVLVCDPRKNRERGSKNDKIDTKKMCQRYRNGDLSAVYQGQASLKPLKEAVKAYETLVKDCVRCRSRLKSLYLGNGIPLSGEKLYSPKRRAEWLKLLKERGAAARAELLFEELEHLTEIRKKAKAALLVESRRHKHWISLFRTIPGFGAIRAAQVLAIVQTPHRFSSRRAFCKYVGLKVEVSSSSDWEILSTGSFSRRHTNYTRGLTKDFSRRLKNVFKGAASTASRRGVLADYYKNTLVRPGRKPAIALVVLARQLAFALLSVWKHDKPFDVGRFLASRGLVTDKQD